jgi:poly(A) polymerase
MNPRAVDIVKQLQAAGHVAYFAGGCVRDHLLGAEAKDYDIATSARPEDTQRLFPRVTDLTGKSFGVLRVMVGDETFEVATFRQDGVYVDGRHPRDVRFATAEEDAQRRDFTVNGLFYDPIAQKLIFAWASCAPSATQSTGSRKTTCGCCARSGLLSG